MVYRQRNTTTMEKTVTYNPNSPLSDKELQLLPEEQLLQYLDSMSEYLQGVKLPTSKRDNAIVKTMNEKGYLTGKKLK